MSKLIEKGNITNLYFIAAIMMELTENQIENNMRLYNMVDRRREYKVNQRHKQNHAQLMQGFKQMKRSIEFLGDTYPDAVGMRGFDSIRSDANFAMRILMRIYNTPHDKQQDIEDYLKSIQDRELFAEHQIDRYRLK